MKDFFNAEIFRRALSENGFTYNLDGAQCEAVAKRANKTLNAALEAAPRVFSYNGKDDWFHASWDNSEVKFIARLFNIEEIKKECVKHEPTEYDVHWKNVICIHCGVELVP